MSSVSFLIPVVLFVIIYTLIVEIFTVLLRMTGVTAEKARTQTISLLTNCGYTTSESEIVLSSRRRRKLAQVIMLCGYSFSVLIVSLLVNFFLQLKQPAIHEMVLPVVLLLGTTIALLVIMRLPPVRSWFDQCIEKVANRLLYSKDTNVLVLVDTYYKKSMMEVLLKHIPPSLDHKTLSESRLKEDHDIQIIAIIRRGSMLEIVNGETAFMPGDLLVLFGNHKNIQILFAGNKGM